MMASCAIREFNAKILYSVSFDEVERIISEYLSMGDLPLFEIAMVVAP